jgi:hypothetical protein
MLGIESSELAWAYFLCIAASALCVLYGIHNWNKGGPGSDREDD